MNCIFCVKHRTAYEMRISDLSSDVSSSDLSNASGQAGVAASYASKAYGEFAIAIGNFAFSDADYGMALGHGSSTTGINSIALGSYSVAGSADVVSFGHAAGDLGASGTAYGSDLNRRLIHVAEIGRAHV